MAPLTLLSGRETTDASFPRRVLSCAACEHVVEMHIHLQKDAPTDGRSSSAVLI